MDGEEGGGRRRGRGGERRREGEGEEGNSLVCGDPGAALELKSITVVYATLGCHIGAVTCAHARRHTRRYTQIDTKIPEIEIREITTVSITSSC